MVRRGQQGAPKHSIKVSEHGMLYGHYYVVEASFAPTNPVARYIAYGAVDGKVELAGSGIEPEDCRVKLADLTFFRVVEEIKAMQGQPSRFMPPGHDYEA